MTEVYKAGNDVDYYEKVLTNLFKKVLENMKEPHKFEPFHKSMREPFDYYELGARAATRARPCAQRAEQRTPAAYTTPFNPRALSRGAPEVRLSGVAHHCTYGRQRVCDGRHQPGGE